MSEAVSVLVPLASSMLPALISAIFLAVASSEPNTELPAKPKPEADSANALKPFLVAAPKPSKNPTSSGLRVSAGFPGATSLATALPIPNLERIAALVASFASV